MVQPAQRVLHFTESVIREVTRWADESGALNLAQGFPDYDPPRAVLEAAQRAIASGENQYPVTWGDPRLREALARKIERDWGVSVDPQRQITVTCGATEGVAASLLAVLNPGDEVILFEPFYENYLPVSHLAGATARFVRLTPPGFRIEEEALRAAVTDRTRVMVLNTPGNPTGRVLSAEELEAVRRVCLDYDLILITDEIYEYFVYDGRRHIPPATLPGMAERTISVGGLSKTLCITGWRIGYVIAPPALSDAVRKVHDFLTVGAPRPLQVAVAEALDTLPASYYTDLAAAYQAKRDLFVPLLQQAGFRCRVPEGAYYVMAEAPMLAGMDDTTAARELIRRVGIAAVPGSSFYNTKEQASPGRVPMLRFAFCKQDETLAKVGERLAQLAAAR
ncbi:MAG TPA: aminotransferase class I/II-fold pyridoxal phosphate-dependent enzyme [Limnochordales bacterium]